MMGEKRFVQLGDTHIKDILAGEEWYAPCTSLLKLLNEQQVLWILGQFDKAKVKELLKELEDE